MYTSEVLQQAYFRKSGISYIQKKEKDFQKSKREKFDTIAAPRGILSGLNPYPGSWTKAEAAHLLKRLCFGSNKQDVDAIQALGLDAAVATLLIPIPDDGTLPINNYNFIDDEGVAQTDPFVPFGETWINAPNLPTQPNLNYLRIISFKGWWLRKMMKNPMSIEEKMIQFWHNHFATEASAIFDSRLTYRHFLMLRTHALGNFKTLAKAVTIDMQMLEYLNGGQNEVGAPDENYARELQELFCIGKGLNSQYTENDVQEAARVLTGWRIDYDNLNSYFDPQYHDTGDKHFSSFYNDTTIVGQIDLEGQNELDALLDMIYANNECALFICRKLYRFFVYHKIDAATEANVIAPLAQILRDNNYDMLPVLDVLFKSEHFFDTLNRAAIIKSPLDFLVGYFRELNIELPDEDDTNNKVNNFWNTLNYVLWIMQQEPCDPPNVAGWSAYYQDPSFDKSWISTATYPRRVEISAWLLFGGIDLSDTVKVHFDPVAFTATMPNANDVWGLIDNVLEHFLVMELPIIVKYQLRYSLLQGQNSDYYWTEAWDNYIADPSELNTMIVTTRLRNFYAQIFLLEEYHLM
ncbi:MAG: DUF1800 domain-containing protein [Saprospiraceae bacterium]|nr:DUF1800 domain-containing protein [Saprospiraceae bacterium]MBP7699646.1 DUF1800 domain-containing protein [Saprospiraceae bacterium]